MNSLWINGNAVQVARFILGFSWIYHGLFPKLITVAPLEKALTGTIGFSAELSTLITKSAGISEILFGAAIIAFYRVKALIWLNIVALLALLDDWSDDTRMLEKARRARIDFEFKS